MSGGIARGRRIARVTFGLTALAVVALGGCASRPPLYVPPVERYPTLQGLYSNTPSDSRLYQKPFALVLLSDDPHLVNRNTGFCRAMRNVLTGPNALNRTPDPVPVLWSDERTDRLAAYDQRCEAWILFYDFAATKRWRDGLARYCTDCADLDAPALLLMRGGQEPAYMLEFRGVAYESEFETAMVEWRGAMMSDPRFWTDNDARRDLVRDETDRFDRLGVTLVDLSSLRRRS